MPGFRRIISCLYCTDNVFRVVPSGGLLLRVTSRAKLTHNNIRTGHIEQWPMHIILTTLWMHFVYLPTQLSIVAC